MAFLLTAPSGISDAAKGQTAAAGATFRADPNGLGGIATISYSNAVGAHLSGTDLTSQADAQAALRLLNQAIRDVAAQEGYIGAAICAVGTEEAGNERSV